MSVLQVSAARVHQNNLARHPIGLCVCAHKSYMHKFYMYE